MKALTILFFTFALLVPNFLIAQDDVSGWKQFINQDVAELKITPIETSNCSVHYRIWKGYQLVDLCRKNETDFSGQVINYVTKEYKSWGKTKYKVLSEIIPISPLKAKELFQSLKSESIETLPDDNEVEGYPDGLDGIAYVFEFRTNTTSRLYSYWEPLNDYYIDGNIPEVVHVRNILNKLYDELKLSESFINFKNDLPKGTYSFGGIIMIKTS